MAKTIDIGHLLAGLRKRFTGENRVKLIVALGIAGIAIILLSEYITFPSAKAEPRYLTDENAQYAAKLEERLYDIVSSIEGVGEPTILVTLQSGVQNIYAQEEKRNTDKTQDFDGSEPKKIQVRDNVEQKYILVDGASGTKEPLIVKTLQPAVEGVVVLCPGADDPVVEQRVVNVITTALGIGSNRVCVSKSVTAIKQASK